MIFYWNYTVVTIVLLQVKHVCPCAVTEYECDNGDCIDLSMRCDDSFDCADFSDETNCDSVVQCPEGLFMCDDGRCVLDIAQCELSTTLLLPSFVTTQSVLPSSYHSVTSGEYFTRIVAVSEYTDSYATKLDSYMWSHIKSSNATPLTPIMIFESSNTFGSSSSNNNVLENSEITQVSDKISNESSYQALISSSEFEMLTSSIEHTLYYSTLDGEYITTQVLLSSSFDLIESKMSQSSLSQPYWPIASSSDVRPETSMSTTTESSMSTATESPLPSPLSSIAVTQAIPTTIVSTAGKGSTPKESNDYTVVIVVVSVVVFLVVCVIVAWIYREHIRRRSRKFQFGSMLDLDMVHPHPDENIGSRNGTQKKGMVKSSSYNALKDK